MRQKAQDTLRRSERVKMERDMSRLFVTFYLLWVAVTFSLAQSPLEAMQREIDEGRYALAAQVSGPSLVRDFPDNPEAHYLYAYALYLTGSLDAARAELEVALSLASNPDPKYDFLGGLVLAAQGDTRGAKALLKGTFARSQDYEVALAWGRVAWQDRDYEEALEGYTAAANTEQGQREVWPHLNRGRMLKALGRLDEAVSAFQRAIEVFQANDPGSTVPDPGYVEAFFRLGEVYELKEDTRQAISFYEAALGADPNYSPARAAIDRLKRSSP